MFKKMLGSLFGEEKPDSIVPNQASTSPQQDACTQEEGCHASHEEDCECDSNTFEVEFDPHTQHGTHYSLEEFDAEVEKRVQAWIASEEEDGCECTQRDIDNFYFNFRRAVYKEWTGADDDQLILWEHTNSMQHRGVATMGFAQASAGDALLEPIHGISLEDFAAIAVKLSSGANFEAVCKAMGIESAVWQEVNTLWAKRMQEDATGRVAVLYGQAFATAGDHPKLRNLGAATSPAGEANLAKLRSDRYFYEELCGARQAAYEYGLDGAQWILDNYGISLGDFQSVASQYGIEQNQNWSAEQILHFHDHQQSKQKEYAAKFAAEQGGNIADDVVF